MHILLGVSKSITRISLIPGDLSYWCVFDNYEVSTGDFLLLYYTGIGIKQLYIVTQSIVEPEELACEYRSMKTIKIKLQENFESPITIKQMKSHPILKGMGAVGRNFQSTIFSIRQNEWESLKEVISENNPKLILDY